MHVPLVRSLPLTSVLRPRPSSERRHGANDGTSVYAVFDVLGAILLVLASLSLAGTRSRWRRSPVSRRASFENVAGSKSSDHRAWTSSTLPAAMATFRCNSSFTSGNGSVDAPTPADAARDAEASRIIERTERFLGGERPNRGESADQIVRIKRSMSANVAVRRSSLAA